MTVYCKICTVYCRICTWTSLFLSLMENLNSFVLKRSEIPQAVPSWSCSKAVYKTVWHIPVPSVHWINSWWWAEELPETCRVSCRSKYGKLVHLVDFIIKNFVTMRGHVNVKGCEMCLAISCYLHIINESAVPTECTVQSLQIRNAAAVWQMMLTSLTCSGGGIPSSPCT
jgi:hypothetical protein